jgi:glycosyltransferase involved in cell wall biosynthesis
MRGNPIPPETAAANAAVFFRHEGFTTGLPKLMGRNAAGAGFLGGLARHARARRFLCYAESREEFEHFRAGMGKDGECGWIAHGDAAGLAAAGTLFYYAPEIGDLLWQRHASGAAAWSVIGLTHTISSARAMGSLGELLVAPAERWDALICTSAAVRRTVQGVLERYGAYLGERLGAAPPAPRLELPVIPLGVDCDAYPQGEALARERAAARTRMKLAEDATAFLFVGRLSYHAKAHPLPVYLALEAAAKRAGRPIALVLAGYYFNESIERAFVEGARRYCPSVRVLQVDGRKPELLRGAWAAADAFISLSDNIQESFGLAPIEAMAAGLPVVASDWDGYRDTIAHGETGFAIPTAMPEAGAGIEFAERYLAGADTYDQYIGRVSQCTTVDVGAAIEACAALAADPALRRRMGDAGRARARRLFDWSVVIAAYEALWRELAARRAGAPAPARGEHPLRGDPFAIFSAYPTAAIGEATLIERVAADPLAEAGRIGAASMNNFTSAFLLGRAELERLFAALPPDKSVPARELLTLFPDERRAAFFRTLGWLGKGNIVRIKLIMAG